MPQAGPAVLMASQMPRLVIYRLGVAVEPGSVSALEGVEADDVGELDYLVSQPSKHKHVLVGGLDLLSQVTDSAGQVLHRGRL